MDFKKILDSLLPFVIIGVGIAIAVGLLFMFFSIAIWGLIIGGVLWVGAMIKQHFFSPKTKNEENGRIIEHDDKL